MSVGISVSTTNELAEAMSDDAAFRRWYDRVLPRVYAYLLSRTRDVDLSEELTQQVFIAAIDGRDRFDGRSDSVTWLCSIARHKLADHFRRLERDERRANRVVVRELALGAPTDAWVAVESREAVATALASLPVSQRAGDQSFVLPADPADGSPALTVIYRVDGDTATFTVQKPQPCTDKACVEQVAWAMETFELGPWLRG